MQTQQDPDLNESNALIASDKVVGTKVYDPGGEHIGSVERLILEKRGGRVAYAVLSFGGFLGIGHDHYPLPWAKLDYDEGLEGFRVDVTKEQVEGAPKYDRDNELNWTRDNDQMIHDYYGIAPYWM